MCPTSNAYVSSPVCTLVPTACTDNVKNCFLLIRGERERGEKDRGVGRWWPAANWSLSRPTPSPKTLSSCFGSNTTAVPFSGEGVCAPNPMWIIHYLVISTSGPTDLRRPKSWETVCAILEWWRNWAQKAESCCCCCCCYTAHYTAPIRHTFLGVVRWWVVVKYYIVLVGSTQYNTTAAIPDWTPLFGTKSLNKTLRKRLTSTPKSVLVGELGACGSAQKFLPPSPCIQKKQARSGSTSLQLPHPCDVAICVSRY